MSCSVKNLFSRTKDGQFDLFGREDLTLETSLDDGMYWNSQSSNKLKDLFLEE